MSRSLPSRRNGDSLFGDAHLLHLSRLLFLARLPRLLHPSFLFYVPFLCWTAYPHSPFPPKSPHMFAEATHHTNRMPIPGYGTLTIGMPEIFQTANFRKQHPKPHCLADLEKPTIPPLNSVPNQAILRGAYPKTKPPDHDRNRY